MKHLGSITGMSEITKAPHYNHGKIEVKDFIRDQGLNFFLGNVIKYVCRAVYKAEDPLEDLRKAKQYIEYEIEYRENGK